MAEVYLARQASLGRQVALKVLKPSLAHDEAYVRRFEHEARAAASLVHANIVQIYGVGEAEGFRFIAQEYVAGQNLRELISRHGPLEAHRAVSIMRQVGLALAKAAAAGLVHRDIKPENIMLARDGEVKVADFGLARVTGPSDLRLTQLGMTMGTPLYMSPEQVEGRTVDPRSDLYSFGVTCYHMLSGSPPFRGETALNVALQHLNTEPKRLEQQRPDLPPALCRIVHKLLAKSPDQRYASAGEMLAELRTVLVEGLEPGDWADLDLHGPLAPHDASLGSATAQLAAVMRTEALAVLHRRRQRWALAGALLLALACGAAGALATREPSLLAGAHAPVVARQASAQAQFLFAQLQETDREAWLKSVEQFFPRADYYVARARQELARYYLQHDRLDDAAQEFATLAAVDDSQPEQRAFGLAGQSIVLTMQGRHEEAVRMLSRLGPLRQRLDPRMAGLVAESFQLSRQAMDARTAAEWDQWVHKLPKPEETSEPAD